jgi:hydrogenase nickel incorporation protein HypA/HybF
MHELSVCQALIDEVEALARAHQARGVVRIRLVIGPLSGVEPALLQHAFPAAAAGTRAAGATLVIDAAPLRVACEACGRLSDAQPSQLVCAACGDWRTRLASGDELTLASVELVADAVEA